MGKTVNSYDDKPADNLTKNGDQFSFNDGHDYQYNNKHWVKLSGQMMDLNSLQTGTGTSFSTSNSMDLIDRAIYYDNMKTITSYTVDIKGFLVGMGLTSIEKQKFSKPTSKAILIAIIYNFYSGTFNQFSSIKEHDENVDNA